MKIKCGLYARISRDATGEGLGVERQQEDCLALAEQLGWEVAETYIDNDTSATSGKPRPAYRRLLADIEAGKIQAIIAWHPDRIYRRLTDLEELIEVIEHHNAAVRTVKAGDLDLSTAYGRMTARIIGSVATGEGEVKVERWTRSWQQRREQGRPVTTGSRTFGYTRDLTPRPDEAPVVRHMVEQVLAGVPLLTIARHLDAKGIKGTRGRPMTPQAIKRLLTNPTIAGWSTLDGRIVAEGQWEPIVAPETWETVRTLLSARSRPYAPRVALLGGLIYCGHSDCGHRLVTSGTAGRRTYRCPNRPGMPGCGRITGDALHIEDTVETYARARWDDPRVRARINHARTNPGPSRQHLRLVAVEQRIIELEKQLDDPDAGTVDSIVRAIRRGRDEATQLRADLPVAPVVDIPTTGPIDWPSDLTERRNLVDLVVARIRLLPATRPSRLGFDPERVQIEPR